MITEYEVPAYLMKELPDVVIEFKYMYPSINIYKTIQCLANYANHKVMQNDLQKVKKCFAVAENLYCNCNPLVKIAIERVFVHAFPVLIEMLWNKEEKIEIEALMPMNLHDAYMKHAHIV